MATKDYKVTTERMSEDAWHGSPVDHLIYLFHRATYDFAAALCVGAKVLDFGCGTGYGTHQLATVAEHVTGTDIAADAVAVATERHRAPNLVYRALPPVEQRPLPFADATFDVVTSFQVIEHVDSVDTYLSEVGRVLRPGGTFLCATPDRTTRLFAGQRPWNLYHRMEFAPQQLVDAVSDHFAEVRAMGMTAPTAVIELELRRCRKMRLLSYPFTFPGAPEPWRKTGLRLLKSLKRPQVERTLAERPSYPFSVADIHIGEGVSPSTNIVIVARRS